MTTKRLKRLSLYPLKLEQALFKALNTPPPEEETKAKPKKKRAKK